MKKRLCLLLAAMSAALLLSGCSLEEFINNLDSDAISGWLLDITHVEIADVKTAQEIIDTLPEELSDLTVGDTTIHCDVTHLALRNRSTDTTRRTDEVECEIELEGDGIWIHYFALLKYTYTTSGGWGLTDWTITSSDLEMEITEGALTQQMEQSCLADMKEELGEENVVYQDTIWDADNLTCSLVMTITYQNNYMITQGDVILNGKLTPNLAAGLNFSWALTQDDSGIQYGVDLAGTSWLVTGSVDNTAIQVALSITDTSIEDQTITLSAVTATLKDGASSYTTKSTDNTTVTYSVSKSGQITASFTQGGHTWDVCFDQDSQWLRMDSSYVSTMQLQAETAMTSTNLRNLLDETVITNDTGVLDYSNTSSGYTYKASDGTLVYEMKVEYPKFSGTNAATINSAISSVVKSFLGKPQISTDQEDLDALAELAAEGTINLSFYDKLVITVSYNKNHYISLLCTYTQKLESGTVTYSYSSINYDMSSLTSLSSASLYTGTSKGLGALLNSYASTARYSDAMVMSYVQTCTLGQDGMIFYVVKKESTGECETITVPYSEGAILVDATASR